MKVIVLLILVTVCIAPCIASKTPGTKVLKSFKPRLENPNRKDVKIVPGGCGLLDCANACLKNSNCRAFQLKMADGKEMKTVCLLLIPANSCDSPIKKDSNEPKELVWLRTGSKVSTVHGPVEGYEMKTALACIMGSFKTFVKDACGSPECAKECNKHADCRGFRVSDHGCEIYRFTACSKNLLKHRCTTKNRIWIRNIPGLPAGSLCPSGYEGKYGASSYKMFPVSNWYSGAEKCKTEKGMVKYADADDREEDLHMHKLKHSLNKDRSFFIGGIHKVKNYFWETCGHEVSKVMWAPGQPSSQRCCMFVNSGLLYGFDDSYADDARYAMCECVNPFE